MLYQPPITEIYLQLYHLQTVILEKLAIFASASTNLQQMLLAFLLE
jgi:hypothetical protein